MFKMGLPFAVFAQPFTATWFMAVKTEHWRAYPQQKISHVNAATSGICDEVKKSELIDEMQTAEFETKAQSCIRGYHIYKTVWTPHIGETMPCSQELTNSHDPFEVKVSQLHGEDERIVGRSLSSMCSIFLRKGVKISASLWLAAR